MQTHSQVNVKSYLPRLLFVTWYLPREIASDSHGVFQRMKMMIKACSLGSSCVQVLFLTPYQNAAEQANIDQVRAWVTKSVGAEVGTSVMTVQIRRSIATRLPRGIGNYFGTSPLRTLSQESREALEKLIKAFKPEIIFAHRLESFRAVRMACASWPVPIIFDLDDIEHLAYARSVLAPPHYRSKRLRLAHVPGLWLEERRALKQCSHVLVCSDLDKGKLQRMNRHAQARAIPNACDMPSPLSDETIDKTRLNVLFVGMLQYAPNSNGMEWFLLKVWPSVLERVPTARLHIVGKGGEDLPIPEEVTHSVCVHGFVDSLSAMYRVARVAICPLHSGGGTRIKIIEAAAYQVPTVATSIGAEGLAFENGKSIALRDSPRAFADAVIELLTNQNAAERMAQEAFSAFMLNYEKKSVVEKVAKLIAQTVKTRYIN
jgi:glycosyltransferase involved in cell wall biosynthesis